MSILTKQGDLVDPYRSFIAKSRYSRWIEEEGRRETWTETVDRYVSFMRNTNAGKKVPNKDWDDIRTAILHHDVMPSMRGLMTAGRALERENLAQFNCVKSDTKIITESGTIEIGNALGPQRLLNSEGKFVDAEVKSFGVDELLPVKIGYNAHNFIVWATANHDWITAEGQRIKTKDLAHGTELAMSIPQSKLHVNEDSQEYKDGVVHGIIYGDGSVQKKGGNAINKYSRFDHFRIRLCGTSRELLKYLEDRGTVIYPKSFDGDPLVILTDEFSKTHDLKALPMPELDSDAYIIGFIRGWLSADGSMGGNAPTLFADRAGKDWMEKYGPTYGFYVLGSTLYDKDTNYGKRRESYNIRLSRKSNFKSDWLLDYKADKVNESRIGFWFRGIDSTQEPVTEEVFCAVVPGTHDFTLSNGLVTGNCSFIAIDDVRAFDESLYVLMNGVGLGFSVESQYVAQLPTINEHFENTGTTVVVEDSKAGWARAFRELLAMLYAGQIPVIDVTKVRPAGARLKTFGGRASGPQPLVDLFDFTIGIFKNAAGRKLTPLEAHDIMCKVGDVVVVGGVRRSALISLSDLNDYAMSKAKSGAWWETTGYRRLANNSATYYKKPSIGEFLAEWGSLYESKAGERGIVNMESFRTSPYAPRRDLSQIQGLNPCGEILLRSKQLCNLTEVVVKEHDTAETLERKVVLASILGTVQSALTNFKYLRKIWRDNCEEERLLGVSLTGQFGNRLLSGQDGAEELARVLDILRGTAIETNEKYAKKLGINVSTAITTCKPSGTVSQLTASSSGMHPWHNDYYFRTVRADNKDPMTQFMRDIGIPNEPDLRAPDSTTVFTFPTAAPESAVKRTDISAIEHLEIWKIYKQHWTEHNPSVTISVKEEEWISVANWVYENWEFVGGISFLPYDTGTYKQAPYQDITESDYNQWQAEMPKVIDWEWLSDYEHEDTTSGSQTLACSAGNCEVVSVGSVEEPTTV